MWNNSMRQIASFLGRPASTIAVNCGSRKLSGKMQVQRHLP